jgi:hypothetical protein
MMASTGTPSLMMEGFLVKEGGSIKTWKKRWCILRDGVLSYQTKKVPQRPHSLSLLSLLVCPLASACSS